MNIKTVITTVRLVKTQYVVRITVDEIVDLQVDWEADPKSNIK